MKKVLILGGTQFIGRSVVERLLELQQYEITLFNRQRTQADLFSGCHKIKGDRYTDDILQLTNQYWDFVIDVSCYYPAKLDEFIDQMEGRIGRYIFISTVSVYQLDEASQDQLITENNTAILDCTEAQKTDTTVSSYGERKAECERVLLKYTWLDKIILRPCIVYGKHDHTDRFYYWLWKIRQQQRFVIPKCEHEKITLTYISDLVNIVVRSMDIKEHSIFYNTSTHEPYSLKEILLKMDANMQAIEIEVPTLLEKGITPGMSAPLWFNLSLKVSNEKLKQDFNIEFIPFEQSIEETKVYYQQLQWPKPKAGFDPAIEQELLQESIN